MQANTTVLVVFCLLSAQALAQLQLYPIQRDNPSQSIPYARTKSLAPILMPFWDDFSVPANTDTLWTAYATVWINQGMAIDAPTFNVATFDGLDASGIPYSPSPSQSLDFGYTDSLVSRRIKMTEVPLFQRNSVFLSFYYQWGGNGEPPDRDDFLRLELLNNEGTWVPALTLQSDEGEQPDKFYGITYRINQEEFFHDGFQFRFRSFGRRSGKYDTWNIDYVYLNKGRNENDLSAGFPDRAIFQYLSPLFDRYYSIPMEHFRMDPQANTGLPSFGVSNMSSFPQPMNYNVSAKVVPFTDGNSTVQTISVTTAEPILPTVVGFENRTIQMTKKPDLSAFGTADSLFIQYTVTLVTGDTVNTGFEPLDFHVNDTIRQEFKLQNYYAYDDGSAEYAAGLTQTGNQVAYRYVQKSSLQDTVNGVYIHYPFTSGSSATSATMLIWDDDNGKPGSVLLNETIPVQRRARSEFILVPFVQAVVVKDTFYIGWQQPFAGRMQVGLDMSHDTGDHIFVNVNGTWAQNTLVRGSLMVRPRFGSGDVITSVEKKPVSKTNIYPNPSSGYFFIDGNVYGVHMLSSNGQTVHADVEYQENRCRVQVTHPLPGLYILRYQKDGTLYTSKVIIR